MGGKTGRSPRRPKRLRSRQQHLVEKNLELVKLVVNRMTRTRPRVLSIRSELESVASEALVEAAIRYDKSHGTRFEVFAEYRIRGAILDYMRQCDPVGRHFRDRMKKGFPVPPEVENISVFGGEAAEEIILRKSTSTTPEEVAAWAETHRRIVLAIMTLTSREQFVANAVFMEQLSMREVGEALGVTESRICQIWNVIAKKFELQLSDLRSNVQGPIV